MDNYLDSKIIIIPKQSMFGKVKVINKRESIINASLTVKQTNKKEDLNSEFWVNKPWVNSGIRVRQLTTIESNLIVVKKIEDYLDCSLMINAHNRMYGKVDMQPASRHWLCYNPIKDVHIREDLPTYNMGNSDVMYVGNKNGYRYRAFMAFDINSIPENMFITQSKLTLHFTDYNAFEDFELSELNREWHEDGTTWNFQPTRRKILGIYQLPDGEIKVVFDVRDIINSWYNKEESNYGFLLKSTDETEYNDKLKGIFSRESAFPPELCVEYLDPHILNPRRNLFNANLIVRNNSQSLLNASLEIPIYYGDSKLVSNINIHNHKMVECSINVNKRILESSIIIRQNEENLINSNLTVKQINQINDFNGNLVVNKKVLLSSLFIPYTNDLNSNLHIRTFEDFNSKLIVNIPWLSSNLYIRKHSSLNSLITIKKETENLFNSKLIVNIPWINSSINIRQHDAINAELIVGRETENLFNSKLVVNIPWLNSNIIIRPVSQIDANLVVYQRNYTDIESNIIINVPWLNSNINIRRYNDLNCNLKTRQHSSLNSNINIRTFNSINSDINIRKYFDLNSTININLPNLKSKLFVRGKNDINGELIIRLHSSLDSSIRVIYTEDFEAELIVKQRFFNDMVSSIEIGGRQGNKAYGFIF